ncbi:uncharacterized protein LOC134207425 [Armigeres subalbatus]|uniref:uncharacterized protein LOC134207425 n=1 Tax=Armigeres subalbatus TaxID=124917 RepID=UPI002ED0AD6B
MNCEIRYTDGSVSSRGVGFGVHGPNLTMSESLPRPCNIFSAEAVAVFIAATYPADKPIVVLTDSASVVSALQSETPKHPWIQGTLAGMIPGTTFAWIPGHCGIRGNTEADALASIGHEGPQYTRSVPLADVKKWTKSVVGQDWARIWNDNTGLFLRKIKGNTISWKDPATQKEQQVISRLRTGHTRVSHNFGGGGPFRSRCDLCDTENSVEHFICRCPKYDYPRSLYGIPGSIRDALADDEAAMAAIFCFLKDAQLFYEV